MALKHPQEDGLNQWDRKPGNLEYAPTYSINNVVGLLVLSGRWTGLFADQRSNVEGCEVRQAFDVARAQGAPS